MWSQLRRVDTDYLKERLSVARSLLKYSGNPILRASNPNIEGLHPRLLLLRTLKPP